MICSDPESYWFYRDDSPQDKLDPFTIGLDLADSYLRSYNFESGKAGWTINTDGTADFGGIVSTSSIMADKISVSSIFPTVSVDKSDVKFIWRGTA